MEKPTEIEVLDKLNLKVIVSPATLDADFDSLGKKLEKGVAQFKKEVTYENVDLAKSSMAFLRKFIKETKTAKKTAIEQASIGIEVFKSDYEKFIGIAQTVVDGLGEQTSKFDDEAKRQSIVDFGKYAIDYIAIVELRKEFNTVDVSDLGTISEYKTKKTGDIVKSYRDKIEAKVNACKSIQDKVDMRLMKLEAECLKAGLKSALTPEYVESFLHMGSDEAYTERLFDLIEIELKRQKVAEEKIVKDAKVKADAEAKVKSDREIKFAQYRAKLEALEEIMGDANLNILVEKLSGLRHVLPSVDDLDLRTRFDFVIEKLIVRINELKIEKVKASANESVSAVEELVKKEELVSEPTQKGTLAETISGVEPISGDTAVIRTITAEFENVENGFMDDLKRAGITSCESVSTFAVFKVEVKASVSLDKISDRLVSMLKKANISSCKSIEVV